MGDLYLAGGPDTVSKGIISMWFRVPSESAAAAFSRYDKWQNGPLGRAYDKDPYGAQDPPPLLGILPLMTFGPIGSAPRVTYGNGTQYVQASQGYAAYIDVGNPPYGSFVELQRYVAPWRDGGNALYIQYEGWNYNYVGPPQWIPDNKTLDGILPPDQFKSRRADTDPSYIGVACYNDGSVVLSIKLETGEIPTVVGVNMQRTAISQMATGYSGRNYEIDQVHEIYTQAYLPPFLIAWSTLPYSIDLREVFRHTMPDPGPDLPRKDVYTDYSAQSDTLTAALYARTYTSNSLALDQWHHLLLGFEIYPCSATGWGPDQNPQWTGPTVRTPPKLSGYSKLWLAVDDVDIPQYSVLADGSVISNASIPVEAGGVLNSFPLQYDKPAPYPAYMVGAGNPPPWWAPGEYVGPTPQYTDNTTSLPCTKIGIPASLDFVDAIFKCEMAEFQMWTGRSIDTTVVSNRRLFLDYKRDKNGHPVADKNGNFTLMPVNPGRAAKALGEQAILLHGVGHWKQGDNTGSLGYSTDPATGKKTKIPTGQFVPTGLIRQYRPDPTIPPPPGVTPSITVPKGGHKPPPPGSPRLPPGLRMDGQRQPAAGPPITPRPPGSTPPGPFAPGPRR